MQAAHVVRQRATPAEKIAELNHVDRGFEMVWRDGHRSIFPLIWLRAHCLSDNELVRWGWHGWEFESKSDRCLVNDKLQGRRYEMVEEDGQLVLII